MPSVAGDLVPVKVWENFREGLDLGAVNSGQTSPFRSAAEGWEGSPLGSIPGVLGTVQLCFSNAIQMKAEGKSHFTGNSSQMTSSFSSEFSLLASLLQTDTWCLPLDQFVYRFLDYHLQ